MIIEESEKTYTYKSGGIDYVEVVNTVRIETENSKEDISKEESKFRERGYVSRGRSTDRHGWELISMTKTNKKEVIAPKAELEFDSDVCICHLIGEICSSCADRA